MAAIEKGSMCFTQNDTISIMSEYLFEREKDILLENIRRTEYLSDGTACRVEMFDVVWRWYDRLNAYWDPTRTPTLMDLGKSVSDRDGIPVGEGLSCIVAYLVYRYDEDGTDIRKSLDDGHLEIEVANKHKLAFHKRKQA